MRTSPGSFKGCSCSHSTRVFFKSLWIAAVWQEDVGKKGCEMANLFPPLFACFMAFLSCCLCIITLLSFKEKKTMRPRFILTERAAFPYSFVFFLSVRSNYTWICSSAADCPGGWLGARAGSQSSSKGTKGTVLIYIHRGSVLGALLSGRSFHFWSLHWQTL